MGHRRRSFARVDEPEGRGREVEADVGSQQHAARDRNGKGAKPAADEYQWQKAAPVDDRDQHM